MMLGQGSPGWNERSLIGQAVIQKYGKLLSLKRMKLEVGFSFRPPADLSL